MGTNGKQPSKWTEDFLNQQWCSLECVTHQRHYGWHFQRYDQWLHCDHIHGWYFLFAPDKKTENTKKVLTCLQDNDLFLKPSKVSPKSVTAELAGLWRDIHNLNKETFTTKIDQAVDLLMTLQFSDTTPGSMKYIHSIINRLKPAKGLYLNKLDMDQIRDWAHALSSCCQPLCKLFFIPVDASQANLLTLIHLGMLITGLDTDWMSPSIWFK